MTFSENISLQEYVDSANQKFDESESRLSEIEGSFQTRMNGKTTGGLIKAMFCTVCWLVGFCVFFWYARGYINSILSLICLGIAVALTISLFVDEIISFSYYGKISSYKNNVTQLKNRISAGKSSIKANQDTFMMSRTNGWYHPLSVGTSIPEEAASIESTINGMESLKEGFINRLKNFLFYTFVIVVTGVGSWALFGVASEIVSDIAGGSMDLDTLMPFFVLGLLVAEVGEVILAKILWSHTDCTVTNTTLWVALLGPVLFLLLTIVVTLIITLLVWFIGFMIAIAAIFAICATLFGAASGG